MKRDERLKSNMRNSMITLAVLGLEAIAAFLFIHWRLAK